MRRGSVGTLALLVAMMTTPCGAQAPGDSLVRQLQSTDWTRRDAAFAALNAAPNAWKSPEASAILIRLLTTEDQFTSSLIKESGGKLGASDLLGEEFGEYTNAVFIACVDHCDRSAFLHVLLNEAARPSPIRGGAVDMLGVYGHLFTLAQRRLIDSTLLRAANDPTSSMVRQSALSALGYAVREDAQMPAAERARIHAAAVRAAADPESIVRIIAVRRLAEFNEPSDRAIITRLVETDTAHGVYAGTVRYLVREAAKQALAGGPARAP